MLKDVSYNLSPRLALGKGMWFVYESILKLRSNIEILPRKLKFQKKIEGLVKLKSWVSHVNYGLVIKLMVMGFYTICQRGLPRARMFVSKFVRKSVKDFLTTISSCQLLYVCISTADTLYTVYTILYSLYTMKWFWSFK